MAEAARATAASIYDTAFFQGLKPDPRLTVSEWADRYRMLSSVASGEPGPWRTSRTPYLQEIMDCLSPSSPVERVVFMKGAQLGGTECGLCWLGYVIHQAPGPMLMVQPTVETAKRYSKQRIDSLVAESPVLRELVRDPRSRDSGNTVLAKEFPGGVLVMTGANSAVGLRSMPVRFLFLDEIDGYPGDADGEGDPVDPQKEINAAVTAIRAGLASRSDTVAANGEDVEETDREIAADNARADALGLVLDSDPRRSSRSGTAGQKQTVENNTATTAPQEESA